MKKYQIVERVIVDRNTFVEVPDDMPMDKVYEQFCEGNDKIEITETLYDDYYEDVIEHEVNELPCKKN